MTNSNDPLLMHKTSSRASYDLAYSEAEKNGGFDAIFVNEKMRSPREVEQLPYEEKRSDVNSAIRMRPLAGYYER